MISTKIHDGIEHGFKIEDNHFELAFQLQDFNDEGSVKNNNAYIEWQAKYVESEGIPSEAKKTYIGVHQCTKENFKRFY